MKNKNAVVGIFVVAGLALFTLGLFLIGDRHQAFARHVEYYAEFENLDGISKGSKVRVAGVDAGQVTGIGIPQSPSSRFRIALNIDERLRGLVRTDSVVTIGTEGIVGDVYLSVRSGSSQAASARPLSTLPTKEPLDITEVLAKGNGLLADTDGAIKRVSGKLDGALDGVKTTVLNVNDVVVGLKAGRGTAGMLLKDQRLATNLRETLTRSTSTLNGIVADLKDGRGAAGLLLRDQALADGIQRAVANAEHATADLNHASSEADELVSTLESHQVAEKLDQVITSTKSATANADEISQQLHQITSDISTPDQRGTSAGTNIRESLANANTTTQNLADDTEALKHNFLLRGFFRRRGYYNLNQMPAEEYRKNRFFTSASNSRVWLSGSELFQNAPTGAEELSRRGKAMLDSVLDKYSASVEGPIVIEGYRDGDDPVRKITLSRTRSILVEQYLQNHLHIKSGNIAIVAMQNLPPVGAGRPAWDGICIVTQPKALHSPS